MAEVINIKGYAETPQSCEQRVYTEQRETPVYTVMRESEEHTVESSADETEPQQKRRQSREHIFHDGDLSVGNDLNVGGVLRAKRIVHPWGCLFHDPQTLVKEIPHPHPGMWAVVGSTYPFDLYRCKVAGSWYKSGSIHWGIGGGDASEIMKFPAGIEIGNYEPGISGAKIDDNGDAEFNSLVVRLKAALGVLGVKGDSTFGGSLSSEDFCQRVSGRQGLGNPQA